MVAFAAPSLLVAPKKSNNQNHSKFLCVETSASPRAIRHVPYCSPIDQARSAPEFTCSLQNAPGASVIKIENEFSLCSPHSQESEVDDLFENLNQFNIVDSPAILEEDSLDQIEPSIKTQSDFNAFNLIELSTPVVNQVSPLSTSCPDTLVPIQSNFDALTKERIKKDNHNRIERKRRFNINDRIKELQFLLPPKDNDMDCKTNKGAILKASCDYIRSLKKTEEENKQLHEKLMKLNTLNNGLINRIKELECLCQSAGLQVPSSEINLPMDLVSSTTYPVDIIKSEPFSPVHSPRLAFTSHHSNPIRSGFAEDMMDADPVTSSDPFLVASRCSSRSSEIVPIDESEFDFGAFL